MRGSKTNPVRFSIQRRERLEGLGEGDGVEGDGDRLGQVESDADGRADGGSERARDDEVLAAALDSAVGGDLGDGEGGGDGDGVADEDDEECPEQADVCDRVTEAQEKDCAEDGADGRQEDRRGAEAVPGGSNFG